MILITYSKAIELASQWHGGQWSALYQFSSSAFYLVENHLLYLEEIIQEIHKPETALRPFHRNKKATNELHSLKKFFEVWGERHGLFISWIDDNYKIVPLPILKNENPKVLPIRRIQ